MSERYEEAAELIRTDRGLAEEVVRQMVQRPAGGLTVRQRQVLDFILDYQMKRGVAPSYGEIADGVGLASKQGPHRIVSALEERGYISRLPGRARSIVVLGAPI